MATTKKTAQKKAGNILSSIFKPSDDCRKAAAKLASKPCDKDSKGSKKACSKAGKVVGSKVTGSGKSAKQGCKFYSKMK
jgi:hypothetical protein